MRPLHRGFWWLVVFLVALPCAEGCRPADERSKEARGLPCLTQDPLEDGRQCDRWSGWRGGNGSGVVRGGRPAIEFGPQKNLRWKTAVPGKGNSSAVIWGDLLLLTTAIGQDDAARLAVLAYSRTDGHLLWQADAGSASGSTHPKNGYASATVATDGRRIVASFGSSGLYCYDFSGKELWHAELGNLEQSWGTAASPVLFEDLVIQLCDSQTDSYLAAFEAASGRPVWRLPHSQGSCWSTPILVETDSDQGPRKELVINGAAADTLEKHQVIAYDPRTGQELWRVQGTTGLVVPTAVASGGLIFSVSGRNGPIMAIRPGGHGDVTESRVVWRLSRGGPYIPSPLVYRNRLYVVTDAGMLSCYDAGNGRLVWRHHLPGPFSASLLAADGRIYATNEQGAVHVMAAGDVFKLLARNELGEECLASPAAADGELFFRGKTHLFCIAGQQAVASTPPADLPSALLGNDGWPVFRGNSLANGVAHTGLPEKLEPLWTFATKQGGFEATAAIAQGSVFVGCLDGKLYALDLVTGKKRWEFAGELGFTAPASVREGLVYVGDGEGRFYAIDAQTGKMKWQFNAEAEIDSGASFHRDRVLVGSQDGNLYCLAAGTGKLVWKYTSPDQIRTSVTVVGDRGLVAGCDGRLHIVDLVSGRQTADVDLKAPTGCTPAVDGPMAFVGTEGNVFFAIDWQKAQAAWQYGSDKHGMPFRSSAAVTPEVVVVGSRDKQVHALDPKTGKELWWFATRGRVDSSPVVVGDRVFVGSADGRLYALDLKTGRQRWQFELGGAVLASPAVAYQRLVIGNDDGTLYCFGDKTQKQTPSR